MTLHKLSANDVFSQDTDIHITLEDQQKINKFARQNAKWEELKEELKKKENEIKNLEDAADELILTEDESSLIPYMAGEVFVNLSLEETQARLEEAKTKLKAEVGSLNDECEKVKSVMSDLKTQLYAKFGNSINLEAEDD
nr:EOG090X0JBP [Triops cancriformis]